MSIIRDRVTAYFARRLREPSTWSGIVLFVTGLIGYNCPPELKDAFVMLGVAVSGMLLMPARESGDTRKVEAQERDERISEHERQPQYPYHRVGTPEAAPDPAHGDGTADRGEPADDGVRDAPGVPPVSDPEPRRNLPPGGARDVWRGRTGRRD